MTQTNNLDSLVKSISQQEIFYTRLIQFLTAVKLCYGGNGLRVYFARHKNIQKYLIQKLHVESLDIDELFDTL